MMTRIFVCFAILSLSVVPSLRADETTRGVQERLKTGGFYFGQINGQYDSDTAAAVTRYQVRNGLQITGKLDAPTLQALGLGDEKSEVALRGFGEDAWRHLRKSDQEYLDRLAEEEEKVVPPGESPAGPAPPAAGPNAAAKTANAAAELPSKRERLRDYVAAFILAGLDPKAGSEAEFFAERANYFGEPNVSRDKIRKDMQRYNDRWPKRKFWLAGELEVTPDQDKLKVTFPIRYDLHNGPRHVAGTVRKTLILQNSGTNDFQIVSVAESKMK